MSRKIKGAEIFDIIETKLDERDEETGKTYRELIAMQIVKLAAGKSGGARETMSAAIAILDRLNKRPKGKDDYLKKAAERNKILERYKVDEDE